MEKNKLEEICNKYVEFTNEILKEFMEELKKDCKSYKEVKDKLDRVKKEFLWFGGNEIMLNIAIIQYAKSLLDKEMNDLPLTNRS